MLLKSFTFVYKHIATPCNARPRVL